MSTPREEIVRPSHDDPLVVTASGAIGGPSGRFAALEGGFWTATKILLVLAVLVFGLGLLIKQPCRGDAWTGGNQYTNVCYSDIGFLYRDRNLAEGGSPYASADEGKQLEYPVLTGGLMYVTARAVGDAGDINDRMRRFYDYTAITLLIAALVTVWATARTHRRRPWDAALVALSPALLLAATINWDLYAVALTSAALLAWSRKKMVLTGALLGLAVAAKFYPLFVLGPLFVLCLRAGKLRDFWRTAGAALVTWVAVNLPVYLAWPEGWKRFYTFSSERGWDFGSFWYALELRGVNPVTQEQLNTVAGGVFVLMCAGIAILSLRARRRPRLPQVVFLVVAAFLVTNKVYSPQFVLWLVPLAALARPRWRDYLIWQACEVFYFFSIWWYLEAIASPNRALNSDFYSLAVFAHIAGTLYFAAMVIRDVVRPENDPVRSESPDVDDPAGGVLDHAPDVFPPVVVQDDDDAGSSGRATAGASASGSGSPPRE